MTAAEVFDVVVRYLLNAGWFRDSDDPGIWIRPGSFGAGGMGIGDALAIQLVDDGVRWPDA